MAWVKQADRNDATETMRQWILSDEGLNNAVVSLAGRANDENEFAEAMKAFFEEDIFTTHGIPSSGYIGELMNDAFYSIDWDELAEALGMMDEDEEAEVENVD